MEIDDQILKRILKNLYYPDSPYEFSVLPADILGQVYEQFLGKVIKLSGRKASVEEKPEVKKSGGVYYTPTYIVQYIVRKSLNPLLEGKTPNQVAGLDKRIKDGPLRVLDPACGSGSFLIQAYQYLLDWYRDQYINDNPQKHAAGNDPKLYQATKGEWRLTVSEKRNILLTHIYGVDIDQQAVEVTKLSLLLKVLEGESGDAIARQMDFFKIRVLPDLADNIRCGNSLISSNFFDEGSFSLFPEDEIIRINTFDWEDEFPFLQETKGFSAIIGNPPWISLTGKFRNEIYTKKEREYLIARYQGNSYMPNMYEYFIAKGLDLMKDNGVFSFIVPDRFGYNDQFVNLRNRVIENYNLEEISYRAPFPNITADTLIFVIRNPEKGSNFETQIGEFDSELLTVKQKDFLKDDRVRFQYRGNDNISSFLDKIRGGDHTSNLSDLVHTTSGVGGKSKAITAERISDDQIEVLKGESINKYLVYKNFYFAFKKENISGRTTDKRKLGYAPKILIRKTGVTIIAAYDDTGRYPEQSLYFTYDEGDTDLYYLLGLLNSKLMSFIYYHTVLTNKASMAQAKKIDLDTLPIKTQGGDKQKNGLIDKISSSAKELSSLIPAYHDEKLEQKKTILKRQISSLEKKIEQAVYDLYDLTPEDINLVETPPE